jgi:inorganic pyrophosphatase
MRVRSSLANPEELPPDRPGDGVLQVIIETPRGSRNKYNFDPGQRIFTLKKVLPAGMVFPYDFGFIPSTRGGDGDPLDVLVLMDEPAIPGCLVPVRLIGVIEAEQREGRKRVRNDRLLAVAEATHLYAHVRSYTDLPDGVVQEIGEFFVNYHRLEGSEYRILGCKGSGAASAVIRRSKKTPPR